ncbi:MAG: hypothetical protein EZS28_049154, partial [Streblomastix strix]
MESRSLAHTWNNKWRADSLSRHDSSGDYAINKEVVSIVLKKIQAKITMDAFTTRLNRQHRVFCCITKDIWAIASESLSINWENQTPLLHPPISPLEYTFDDQTELWRIGRDSEIQDEEELMVSPSRINLHIQVVMNPNEKLFRFKYEDHGLKQLLIQRIVKTWQGQWRRHVLA